jgi:putative ATPase
MATQQDDNQIDLFQTVSTQCVPGSTNSATLQVPPKERPLAFQMRPTSLKEFKGGEQLCAQYPFLTRSPLPSTILWGPPGCGKTSLAHLLAQVSGQIIHPFSAVLGGLPELRALIKECQQQQSATKPIIFIDEIHRFNRSQQDALLPYVESGEFTLLGATTENPTFSINRALLSRAHQVELTALSANELVEILQESCQRVGESLQSALFELIADYSSGDARRALNNLEIVLKHQGENLEYQEVKQLVQRGSRHYDHNQDRHYDVISAFIKSLRGSDPDAALLWLAVMLDGGEDPVFIARRLIIFASEDIGNADPQSLTLAVSTMNAVAQIGMPEARINLAQAVTYLASTTKSNASYLGINRAMSYVSERETIDVPDHLKSRPPKSAKGKYLYPHDFSGHYTPQSYCNDELPNFYQPTSMGVEAKIKERLDGLHCRRKPTNQSTGNE